MNIACIRHSQIPGSSPLFLDLLYRFDKTAAFYPYPPELKAAHAAAQAVAMPADRRRALVAALGPRNADGGPAVARNLERLGRPETVVVAAGQQVGLFGGPLFALYKALTAAKHAAWLTEQGLPAVPVFWLATEDHDLDEIDHTRLLDGSTQSARLQAVVDASPEQPAGRAVLADCKLEEVRRSFEGLDYAEETTALLEQAYRPGTTFGDAFAKLFSRLLEPYGVILLDPLTPAVRRLAAPLVRRALEQNAELAPTLLERGAALEAAGYHQQVQVSNESSFFFLMEDGRRKVLRRKQDGFQAGGARYTLTSLLAKLDSEPEAFSPNALLRPVVQDWLLPTAAFIAGPSELAYLAQSSVLYDRLLGRAPVFLPRASFTIFDARRRKLLERYGFHPADLFVPAEELHRAIGRRLTPPEVARGIGRASSQIESALDALGSTLESFDPTLAAAVSTSRRKMLYQVGKIESKVEREALLRTARAQREADGLAAWVYPEKTPQERYYGILPFLARFGPRLAETAYHAVRPECPDHQALAL